MKSFKRWAPFVLSFILIAALVAYAPWGEIGKILSHFSWQTILLLIFLSALYYALKSLRFWYILLAMGIRRPLSKVTLSYMSAQPISLVPAGEIYRSHALQRHTGVPVHRSIGQFTLQGLLEGSAMALLMLISALALGTLRTPALVLCILVLVILLLIQNGYLDKAGKQLNRLPFINITEKHIEQFSRRNRTALSRQWLPRLFGLSILIELAGTAIAYTSVVGIGGHLNIFQAALLYVIPVIVGFISFLPGGIGLSEQSAVGVLLLSKEPIAIAVAATLIMRVAIVGLGVVFGVIALAIANTGKTALPEAARAGQ